MSGLNNELADANNKLLAKEEEHEEYVKKLVAMKALIDKLSQRGNKQLG